MEILAPLFFIIFWSIVFNVMENNWREFPSSKHDIPCFDDLREEVISMGCKKGKKGGK